MNWHSKREARFLLAEFDREAREARWDELMTSGMAGLEAQHAGFLADDFEPNADWWGSEPVGGGAPDQPAPKARL